MRLDFVILGAMFAAAAVVTGLMASKMPAYRRAVAECEARICERGRPQMVRRHGCVCLETPR
jgi:hypothetical protein